LILDTNAVSALLAGDEALGGILASEARHHLPVIVVGEYRFGLLRSRRRDQLTSLLTELIRQSMVLDVDLTTSEHYGRVREWLRAQGRPIPENDVWIAALALQHDIAIVSRDGHFDEVDGLRRIGW